MMVQVMCKIEFNCNLIFLIILIDNDVLFLSNVNALLKITIKKTTAKESYSELQLFPAQLLAFILFYE